MLPLWQTYFLPPTVYISPCIKDQKRPYLGGYIQDDGLTLSWYLVCNVSSNVWPDMLMQTKYLVNCEYCFFLARARYLENSRIPDTTRLTFFGNVICLCTNGDRIVQGTVLYGLGDHRPNWDIAFAEPTNCVHNCLFPSKYPLSVFHY